MKKEAEIKSPLRYPGGKSRACSRLYGLRPEAFDEYREPFVGGGSFFIYLQQRHPHLKSWINDANPEVYHFWKMARDDSEGLAWAVRLLKAGTDDGRALHKEMRDANVNVLTDMERAVRFFVLNRITFSGVAESGGYSGDAFHNRFTESSIDRVARLGEVLEGVKVTCLDYSEAMSGGDEHIFTFLDPPYLTTTDSKLYGKEGVLHTGFDHARLVSAVEACKHSVLITYDDAAEINEMYKKFNIRRFDLQYGMNNANKTTAKKGREVFISNYQLQDTNND